MKNQEQMINWSGHQQNSHKLRLTQENCSHHPVNGELYIGRTGFYHLNPSINIRNTKSETANIMCLLYDSIRSMPSHLWSIITKN